MGGLRCVAVAILTWALVAPAQARSKSDRPVESKHRAGPHDMEGWTLDFRNPGGPDSDLAFTLVLSRHDKVIRRIKGEPLIWQWIFWDGGREVAYETGPLHFAMQCNLVDVASGKLLQSVDCFHELPENPPQWLSALENRRQ